MTIMARFAFLARLFSKVGLLRKLSNTTAAVKAAAVDVHVAAEIAGVVPNITVATAGVVIPVTAVAAIADQDHAQPN